MQAMSDPEGVKMPISTAEGYRNVASSWNYKRDSYDLDDLRLSCENREALSDNFSSSTHEMISSAFIRLECVNGWVLAESLAG